MFYEFQKDQMTIQSSDIFMCNKIRNKTFSALPFKKRKSKQNPFGFLSLKKELEDNNLAAILRK